MSLFQLLLVALVQGITEFLPISSSGHLVLLGQIMEHDQGQLIDVAVHLGTLGAVILYFWPDAKRAFQGLIPLAKGDIRSENARLAFLLVIATIPAIILGLVMKITNMDDALRSIKTIAWTTLIFGLILYWFDSKSSQNRTEKDWNLKDAILMGLWQAIALIPGVSRSGACITGARQLGFNRHDGAKIAMLMSIPTIIASGSLLGLEIVMSGDYSRLHEAFIGAILAFLAALLALKLMMALLRSVSFTPYVIYRVILGVVLLVIAYS